MRNLHFSTLSILLLYCLLLFSSTAQSTAGDNIDITCIASKETEISAPITTVRVLLADNLNQTEMNTWIQKELTRNNNFNLADCSNCEEISKKIASFEKRLKDINDETSEDEHPGIEVKAQAKKGTTYRANFHCLPDNRIPGKMRINPIPPDSFQTLEGNLKLEVQSLEVSSGASSKHQQLYSRTSIAIILFSMTMLISSDETNLYALLASILITWKLGTQNVVTLIGVQAIFNYGANPLINSYLPDFKYNHEEYPYFGDNLIFILQTLILRSPFLIVYEGKILLTSFIRLLKPISPYKFD